MRDHAVGAFGAVALVLVCLIDASALGALGAGDDALVAGLVAGGAAAQRSSRWPVRFRTRATEPARAECSKGSVGRALSPVRSLAVLGAAVAGSAGIVAVLAAAVTAAVLAVGFHAWLGGITGDTLGATAKLCETAALVAYLAAVR